MANEHVLAGCDFDQYTASATHGSKVLALIASQTDDKLLAVSGQTGLSFNLDVESSQTNTKDAQGGWAVNFPGVKSWNMSLEGLTVFDDAGRKAIVKAIADGTFLCAGIYKIDVDGDKTKYTCLRKGLAIPTSDSIDAPSDDNTTFSVDFQGTGKPYLFETASEEERKKHDFEDDGTMSAVAHSTEIAVG